MQVCYKIGNEVVKTVHVGSSRSEKGVEKLMKKAREIMDAGKNPLFDLDKFTKK